MKKAEKHMLVAAGIGALALYFMRKSSSPASAGTAAYVGDYDMGSSYDPTSGGWISPPADDGSILSPTVDPGRWISPPAGDPGGWVSPPANGGGYSTAPIRGQGSNPHWRKRYGRHINDANSSYGWNGWPGWYGQGSNYSDMLSPFSGFGPSAVELEQPGSIAAMASDIDEGAY